MIQIVLYEAILLEILTMAMVLRLKKMAKIFTAHRANRGSGY